ASTSRQSSPKRQRGDPTCPKRQRGGPVAGAPGLCHTVPRRVSDHSEANQPDPCGIIPPPAPGSSEHDRVVTPRGILPTCSRLNLLKDLTSPDCPEIMRAGIPRQRKALWLWREPGGCCHVPARKPGTWKTHTCIGRHYHASQTADCWAAGRGW